MDKKDTLEEKIESARKQGHNLISENAEKLKKMVEVEKNRARNANSEEEAEEIMDQLLVDMKKESEVLNKKLDALMEPYEKDLGIGKYKKIKD